MPTSTRGGAAAGPNPFLPGATGTAASKVRRLAPSGLEQLQAATRRASAPADAQANLESGGTQGVEPWMKATDLGTIRRLNTQHPDLAQVIPGLTNPISWGVSAVHGAQQAARGVSEVAHGKLGHGAADVGLGGLGLAAVLPVGKGVKALRETVGEAARAAHEAEAAAKVAHEAGAAKVTGMSMPKGEYPHAPDIVDGRRVREGEVPNMSSIPASLEDYTILPGIREVPMHDFELSGKHYSVEGNKRIAELQAQIKHSKEITPLIVVIDKEGSYILEGSTRADALKNLGARSFPAVVVRDEESLAHIEHPTPQDSIRSKLADETGSLDVGALTKNMIERPKQGRSGAEAAAHVEEAARQALAEGHGPAGAGGLKNAPVVMPGEHTPETGGEAGARVREALKGDEVVPGAVAGRSEQADLVSAEKGKRASAAQDAMDSIGGVEGHHAALHELKGEYPRITWNNEIRDLDQNTFDEIVRHAQEHPALRTFERIRVVEALAKMVDAKVPTKSEQALLERAFGKETAGQLMGSAHTKLTDLLNVPRALMSSMDFSAPFRQGLVAGVTHPATFFKNFAPMFKSAVSEDYFQQAVQDEIHARPTYPLMDKARIAFTDLGADPNAREEARMSNFAERIPGLGRIVRGSDRAYVGFLNKTRADLFDNLIQGAAKAGWDVNDQHLLESLGSYINAATGRGDLGALNAHTASLNALFFSPRLMASRMNFLGFGGYGDARSMVPGSYYMSLHPAVRMEGLKSLAALATFAMTVLTVAKVAGASINTDPTNADFAKMRVGNTRIDVLGGFQQYVRLFAELQQNKVTSSTTGKSVPLGTGFAKTTRLGVITRFLQGKFSPVPSMVFDTLRGEDFEHRPVKWNQLSTMQREAASHLVPFLAQDLYSLYSTEGTKGLAVVPADVFGVGVQSYKAKAPKSSGGGTSNGFGNDSNEFLNGGSLPTNNPFIP